ncbi:flagellar biosynthesis anti-sigma factor FlgM [Acutalibacter muris]|jgi:anti-sigma28 factor (negative regulator of flagellin synthesis)|uniref:flagellar biosynthesis anti-sigma factor FlgM n=1 Tax=Acutalibacter muris TaxID=1796620 RepID=UPI00272C4AF8|nr:flagellar biosynthesis anti-sigma factor FlgM [Acutalibacter muris]MCI9543648.1 flagellar biosynthesis anti-sigma factor FlgM [Acutalibacter muris]
MINMSNINPISPAGSRRVNQPRSHGGSPVKPGPSAEKFDQVTLSTREGEDPMKMELQGKLSQEVRTATTTGTLNALRQEVQSGRYQVDARSIAKKLLLMGEV